MRKTRRSKSKIIIGILSSIVLALTIGYSFLSLNLRISGLAHIGAVWNIHFDNITINPDSVSLSSGDIEPEIDDDNDCKINYKVTLTPGDFYEFTFDIVNSGTIDGMIQNMITRIEEDATATFPSYIDYTVSYEDDVVLETNQQLLKGTTETLKVKVEFKDEENVPQSETLDLSYENNYVKKTSVGTEVMHPIPLYSVFEDEYDSNSGLVLKYTGSHHDSYSEEPSKDIYYWHGTGSDTYTSNIRNNKNNVIFANSCWKMFRTTDTGGVKLFYSGTPSNDGKCNNSTSHIYYNSVEQKNLNGNYWYGTDFSFDSSNNTFSLSGDLSQATWSDETHSQLIGKYTCISADQAVCNNVYFVHSYSSSTTAYLSKMRFITTESISTSEYNSDFSSLSHVGYMHGNVVKLQSLSYSSNVSYENTQSNNLSSANANTSYLYANSFSYEVRSDYSSSPMYYLNDTFQIDSETNLSTLVGKYTFLNSSNPTGSNSIYYIVGYSGSQIYGISLSGGRIPSDVEPVIIGDSIESNGDGTYRIENYSSVYLSDWFSHHSNYRHKYTCWSTSAICSVPKYLIGSLYNKLYYLRTDQSLLIAKTRNGTQLSDTLVVRIDELFTNPSNYSDYKYTCKSLDSICTESNLSIISSISSYCNACISYIKNHYYGQNARWDGEKYILENTLGIELYNNFDQLSTHHYVCEDIGATECTKVNYVAYYPSAGSSMSSLVLENGISINDALNGILSNNTYNSEIKTFVDEWYKRFLLQYSNSIEDTIYCNDRSVVNYGEFNPNGGSTTNPLLFKNYSDNTELSCANVTDQFSVSNSYAHLEYKIGLLTRPEAVLVNSYSIGNYGYFWTMSPISYSSTMLIKDYNYNVSGDIRNWRSVRPVISLMPGIKYTEGDGSINHPYIIKNM